MGGTNLQALGKKQLFQQNNLLDIITRVNYLLNRYAKESII